MSPCPSCGTGARHVALILPWDTAAKALVEHRCEVDWCPMATFREPVTDPAAFAQFLRLRYWPEITAEAAPIEVGGESRGQ